MPTQWLRLWHEMPNDPKWRTIARVSGQSIPAVIAVYLHVLVNASNASERGRTENLCTEDIGSALDLGTEQIAAILDAMQGRVLDGDQVSGWSKRQVEREDGSAARAKAWREAKKIERTHTERNRTQPNATELQDTDTDKDKEKPLPPPLSPPKGEESPAEPKKRRAIEKLDTPDWLPKTAWEMWQRHRKHLTADAHNLHIRTLSKLRDEGNDPVEVIEQSIAAGWQGLFAVKRNGAASNGSRFGSKQQSREEKWDALYGKRGSGNDVRNGDGQGSLVIEGTAERVG